MSEIGRLVMEEDGLYVDIEYEPIISKGFKLKVSNETCERIHNELIESLEDVDRDDETWEMIKLRIKDMIDELK